MKISWLENGIKDSLKIQIKRQMKLLPDSARTTQAFLKIAKDEQELQEENVTETEPSSAYTPYFANTVSTTSHQKNNTSSTTQSARSVLVNPPTPANTNRIPRSTRHNTTPHDTPDTTVNTTTPCYICKRSNHRTIDCYYRKPSGCYKCGQHDHRVRDCPQVFC